ncbi:MAG: GGDEF domain-containing protein [Bacilli bacterium]|nr:GGDEF domain-containing protein [Bacilli bacterium]
MTYLQNYIITNFILLCVALVMSVMAIQKRKEHRRISMYILLIMGTTVLLSILEGIQLVFQDEMRNIFLSVLNSCICYVLRPLCPLLFIFLSHRQTKKIWNYILLIPIAICTLIYIIPLIPGCESIVFTFGVSRNSDAIVFYEGNTILRYTSHIVSAIYLAYLTVASLLMLNKRHIFRALSILICDAVTIVAVIIETFFNLNGEIHIVNSAIAISTVFYYLFIHTEKNQYDVLTGLYNRAVYYIDIEKLKNDITAIIQIDMNALKYWNDTFGHEEGDKGLKTIADAITSSCTYYMYAYRVGGDEFIIVVEKESEETVIEAIKKLKKYMEGTKFRCSVGYCYRHQLDNIGVNEMLKFAERKMYEDKAEFYKGSNIDRRKAVNPEGE